MATVNKLATPLRSAPKREDGQPAHYASLVLYNFQLSQKPSDEYNPGGDGSARDFEHLQAAFIDNAANAKNLVVYCFGTQLRFIVPANCQGWFLVPCPVGGFGVRLSFADNSLGADVPVQFTDAYVEPALWRTV